MTQLHNVNNESIVAIRNGLNQLGENLLNIQTLVGESSSRITVDGGGAIRVAGLANTFEGQVGIKVDRITEGVDLEVAGSIKFQGKKQEVGDRIPTSGFYRKADIVWNDDPRPAGNLGWICIRTGTPGEWKPFGNIGG